MVQLNRSLGGLNNVIEYKDAVPNSRINDCCGRKAGKGTERNNEGWFVQSGTRKERRS